MYGSYGRVLQMRSAALGALRRDLITALGSERAKGFLLRYGWSLGKEDAIHIRREAPGMTDIEWLAQGPRLHSEGRMVRVVTDTQVVDRERRIFRVEGAWEESYEAIEHLRHFPLPSEPVCWTLVGYAGGYSSEVFGERVIYKEVACVAKGDPVCRFIGMPAREWGVRAVRELPLYDQESLAEELESSHQRIRQQNAQLQQMVSVHDGLSRALLLGLGLKPLAEEMGSLLGCTVTVEDRQLRLLAMHGRADASTETLGAMARRDPSLRAQLKRVGRERRAITLGAQPGPERVVAPIVVGDDLLGFVTTAVAEGLTPSLSRMLAERFALACGLELMKERTALEVEQRLRGDFLDNLLTPGGDEAFLNRWARHLGVGLTETDHRFFLVQPVRRVDGEADCSLLAVQEKLKRQVQEVLGASGLEVFAVPRGGALVALLPCEGHQQPAVTAAQIHQAMTQARMPVWVAISRRFQGAAAAAATYEECRNLLAAMQEADSGGPIIQVDRMGAMQLLSSLAQAAAPLRFAEDLLGPLIQYDASHQSDLVPTLHKYLQLEGNLQQTARQLSISISGLKYRLQRIQEVGQIDLNDPEQRFDLMVALRLRLLSTHQRPSAKKA